MPNRNIKDLDKRTQPFVREFVSQLDFGTWKGFITEGFRSNKRQAELYAKGRTKPGRIVTNAKPGQSNHNKGLAIDIAFKNNKNKLNWNVKLFKDASVIAKKLGFTWGGDWKSFRDNPHFEMTKFSPAKLSLSKLEGLITYKKWGKSAVYVAVGNLLIPFVMKEKDYRKEFDEAEIEVLSAKEFKKFVVAKTVKIIPS